MSASFIRYIEVIDENGNVIDGKIYVSVSCPDRPYSGKIDTSVCIIIETEHKYWHITSGWLGGNVFREELELSNDPAEIYRILKLSTYKCTYVKDDYPFLLQMSGGRKIHLNYPKDKNLADKNFNSIIKLFNMNTITIPNKDESDNNDKILGDK